MFAEAGALMVIETVHAKARGANIFGRLMGAGITSDGHHVVAPDPSGERAGHAMARAIELAGLTPRDIGHVNAHATGTAVGDLAEAKAISNALGAYRPVVYAPKAALGYSWWPTSPSLVTTSTRSTIRSVSAATTWPWPSADTDTGPACCAKPHGITSDT